VDHELKLDPIQVAEGEDSDEEMESGDESEWLVGVIEAFTFIYE
jgi:hypothetical protein